MDILLVLTNSTKPLFTIRESSRKYVILNTLEYIWPHLYNNPITHCNIHLKSTVVSRIYTPHFATLALVESVGGAYMRDLTFYLANTPPVTVPCRDEDIPRPIEAAVLLSLLMLSYPEPQKLDGQDRLTEVGHSVDSGVFQAFHGFVLSMCCC